MHLMHPRRAGLSTVLVLLVALATPARAEDTKARADFGGDNLAGLSGLAHTMAAANHPAGYIAVGTNLEFFSASEFVYDGANKRDHSRFVNSYSLSFAPLRFLEAAIAINVTSDNTAGAAQGLQVAVGDPRLTIKGGYELMPGLALGGLLDLSFYSGNGFFEAAFSSTRLTLAALASYTLPSLPLSFHLNVGFVIDGSKNLLDVTQSQDYELFAAQVSSFNRVITRLGIEYATKYFGPFLEFSMEPFVGSGNPGFSGSPLRLTLGARAWLGKQRALQLMAGADIGLAGVGPRDAPAPAAVTDKYAFTIPRWNMVLRLSYRFDPFAPPEVKIVTRDPVHNGNGNVRPGPALASIGGAVIDGRTGKPIWNARVRIGAEVSSLAVDANGKFTSYKMPVGPHKLVVSAHGYHETTVDVTLAAEGATQTIKLSPRAAIAPGTIRGTVKAMGGKKVRKATLLIPEIDRTISIGRDGAFTVSLKPGEYKVVVSARGYRTQRKTLRVVEGETVILNVELHR